MVCLCMIVMQCRLVTHFALWIIDVINSGSELCSCGWNPSWNFNMGAGPVATRHWITRNNRWMRDWMADDGQHQMHRWGCCWRKWICCNFEVSNLVRHPIIEAICDFTTPFVATTWSNWYLFAFHRSWCENEQSTRTYTEFDHVMSFVIKHWK